jgi:hypothetical protein
MARSFLPDPLDLLRQAVNRLDGRAPNPDGRGIEIDAVMKALQQVSGLSLALRQALETAMEGAYKRVNLPAGREFAEMNDTLRRLEDKLDRLLAAQAEAKPPPRTRKPAAGAPAAKAAKPRKAAAAPRRRSAP